MAHGWAGDAFAARRQRDRARELLDHDGTLKQREAGPAIFFRHLHHPDAEVLGALLEARQELRLDLLALGRDGLALDRNELGVDKAPQGFLEHPELFGQLEFHYTGSSASSVRPREGGDPDFLCLRIWPWIPACAGTNGVCCSTSASTKTSR